jgi:hypothetical protein
VDADDRWRQVTFTGDPDGITVRRRTSASAALAAPWLEDLWLAERLAHAVGGGDPKGPTSVQMH